ncbi:hypothetical protein [Leptolyngbya sp. GGD]|uniref:hypothetical protein n=1 Tax=Leptolyngbya sp. GGD TaxID=2997907 RepID=UPI00227C4EDB|nr:hypothetical protein [Leptolyngbya sp. GGD]MCY6492203.1 hypothetical protein [Leptolyngbya sp. GGD]
MSSEEISARNHFKLGKSENTVELTITATSEQMADYFYDLIERILTEAMRTQLEQDLNSN